MEEKKFNSLSDMMVYARVNNDVIVRVCGEDVPIKEFLEYIDPWDFTQEHNHEDLIDVIGMVGEKYNADIQGRTVTDCIEELIADNKGGDLSDALYNVYLHACK